MGALDDDKDTHEEEENEKAQIDENVPIVSLGRFLRRKRIESLNRAKWVCLGILCQCGRLVIMREGEEAGYLLDGVGGRQVIILC